MSDGGNDVKEDLAAGQLGIKTWLVTDCLEHGEGLDLTKDVKANYQSTLEDFWRRVAEVSFRTIQPFS